MISGSHGPDLRLPESSILEGWIDQLAEWGYRSVRTSALSPGPAAAFARLGFTPVQELILLSAVLDTAPEIEPTSTIVVRAVKRVPGRPHSSRVTRTLLRLDRAAFGDDWCMDPAMFDESRTATRRSRLFVAGDRDRPEGFVAVGASGPNGFVQRLAVEPSSQRKGVASHLIADAMRWLRRIGCSQAIVNTATNNLPALALYRAFGFQPMDHGLSVLERSL